LVLIDGKHGHNVDSVYWRYETLLKQSEDRLGALVGANGAIYAIRKEAFTPIPDETLVDDFVIPLLSKLKTSCDIVYDSEAVATEETPADIGSEFHRRARIGAGGFQSLAFLWRLLDPRWGWLAFSFFSHKVLRWLSPLLLLTLLSSNVFLPRIGFYRIALELQCAVYLIGALGALYLGSGLFPRLVRLVTLFTSVNAALLVGLARWLSGRQQGTWQRTAR
jgi:cellulose synthase/poly-beta-1,6-N-acetylglucosamine synthase-like glycosyltransferase